MTFKERKQKVIEWVKVHKTELILVGISILTLLGIISSLENDSSETDVTDELDKILNNSDGLTNCCSETTIDFESNIETYKEAFSVKGHIRQLPEGFHASEEKIKWANENGVNILDNQTWVSEYTKGGVA